MSAKVITFFLLHLYVSTTPTTAAKSGNSSDGFTCDPVIDCLLPSEPNLVPDISNCQQFYICNSGVPDEFPLTCGEGYHFNGDVDTPNCIEGDCSSPICPNYSPTCKTSCAELLPATSGAIVFPGDPTKFMMCIGDQMLESTCNPGFYFNGVDCSAETVEDACGTVCGVPMCSYYLDHHNLPDKSSCSQYYFCLDGNAILQSCPTDTTFDLYTAECVDSNGYCSLYCTDTDP